MAAANEKRIQDHDYQLDNQQVQDQHDQDNKPFEVGQSSNSINLQLGVSPIGLNFNIPALINQIEGTLIQETHKNEHQPQVQKSKAFNIPAVSVRIGSWLWVSKHEGDLVAKFYYGKKKLVWEFLFGSLKKKIEFGWSQISAINAFVHEDKMCYLALELNKQPGLYKEVNYQAKKHSRWNTTHDFTDGQASRCRRHMVIFPPRVLDEPLKKLLQCDSNLFNLSRQPFPTHSPLFQNHNIIDFTLNRCVHGSSLIHEVNSNHQGAVRRFGLHSAQLGGSFAGNYSNTYLQIPTRNQSVRVCYSIPEESNDNKGSVVPFGPNFVPPGGSYAGPSSSILPIPGRNESFHVCYLVPEENNHNNKGPFVPFVQNVAPQGGSFVGHSSSHLIPVDLRSQCLPQNAEFSVVNQVWEHSRYNQIQDISVTPFGAQHQLLPNDQKDLCIPDQLPKLVVMDTENMGGYTDKEPSFTFDPTCKPFTESYDMKPTNSGDMVDQLLNLITFEDPGNSWLPAQDGIRLMDDCDDYLSFRAELAFQYQNSSLPSEYSMLDFNDGVNQMGFQDNENQTFDPSGSNSAGAFHNSNSGGSFQK